VEGVLPAASCAIFTPTLAPIRVAPASTILRASSRPFTPPEALTPSSDPTVRRISATSATVAPPFEKPVEVFTKSAPAFFAALHARTFSSSVNNTVSCSSCHLQKHGFADPNRFSKGFDGRHTDRHAMNLVDLRYHSNHRFFWDERAPGLEETVLLPIQNRLEMGQDLSRLVALLEADRRYPRLFRSAFGSPVISPDRIGRALAQFLRSIVSYQSRYDDGRAAVASSHEDFANFTAQENRGKALFLRHCATCHMPGQDAHLSMPFPTNNGLDQDPVSADGGIGEMTLSPRDVGRFKSPSLRNVAVTGPYMHNGQLATLDAVVDHYSSDFKPHPNLDGRMRPLNFTVREKAAIVAFLNTLTDPQFLNDPKFSDPFGLRPQTR